MSKSQKRILMLGGAYSQIPAIKYAKQAGYYVITCDYLPDNPGHKYADEYHNVSTTDKEEVLMLAQRLEIDGILAYASDPSMPTAAYVSDALGLSGASYESVRVLSEKDLFRTFLQEHGFCTPRHISIDKSVDIKTLECLQYPCYVKPVDSSGSKGISVVSSVEMVQEAILTAQTFSKNKRVIVEEYIRTPYNQLHGDGFVLDGELIFLGLGDQHFCGSAPYSTTYPSRLEPYIIEKIRNEVDKVLKGVGFKNGAINVEARLTKDNEVFIVEIGPRSGGNYIPQLMQCATGFDEVAATVELAMGNKKAIHMRHDYHHCLQYIIGSTKAGKFLDIEFSEFFKERIQQKFIHKNIGQQVTSYTNSSDVIGVVIAKFNSAEELKSTIESIHSHVRVMVT